MVAGDDGTVDVGVIGGRHEVGLHAIGGSPADGEGLVGKEGEVAFEAIMTVERAQGNAEGVSRHGDDDDGQDDVVVVVEAEE